MYLTLNKVKENNSPSVRMILINRIPTTAKTHVHNPYKPAFYSKYAHTKCTREEYGAHLKFNMNTIQINI